jgi:hypothetical protein
VEDKVFWRQVGELHRDAQTAGSGDLSATVTIKGVGLQYDSQTRPVTGLQGYSVEQEGFER